MKFRFVIRSGLAVFLTLSGCYKDGASSGDETPKADPDSHSTKDDSDSHSIADLGLGLEWVTLTPGTFMMGSPEDEEGHNPNEQRHEVTLTHGFETTATEVTVQAWTALGFPLAESLTDEYDTSPAMPVSTVTQQEVCEWLDALSAMMGLEPCYGDGATYPTPYHCPGYRLPTEAEWEYAARAGTETATYAGNPTNGDWVALLDDIAWCSQGDWGEYLPVASRAPNAFGIYDMLGNVGELAEWLGIYKEEPAVNPFHPSPPGGARERMLVSRGGSYLFTQRIESCRAASRNGPASLFDVPPTATLIGFRPVRTLPGSDLPEPTTEQLDPCPGVAKRSCSYRELGTLLLSAEDVGEYARFSSMVMGMVTAIIGTRSQGQDTEVFLAEVHLQSRSHATWPLADSDGVSPVALVPTGEDEVKAVLCGAAECYLASARVVAEDPEDAAEIAFTAIEGTGFSSERNPKGAVSLSDGLVVAGDGVLIFEDDEWVEAVPPGSGPAFNAVAASAAGDVVVAVGNAGRVAVMEDGAWHEVDTGVSENLLGVAVTGNRDDSIRFTAVGEAGRTLAGWEESLTSCTLSDSDLRIVRDNESDEGSSPLRVEYHIADDQATLLYLAPSDRGEPPCVDDMGSMGQVRDFGLERCGFETNFAYLFEHELHGQYVCSVF